jgi:hypothetical protein
MLLRLFMVILVATGVGCGSSKSAGPPLVATEGIITLKDKPLAGATVFFHPDDTAGLSCAGNTDENGKFVLWTNGKPGAVAGRYRITVKSYTKKDGSPLIVTDEQRANGIDADQMIAAGLAKLAVPAKYVNRDTTTLNAEVLPSSSAPIQVAMK